MCKLIDKYWESGKSEGIQQGIQAVISTCKKLNAGFETTASEIKEQFHLDDAAVQDNMRLYW